MYVHRLPPGPADRFVHSSTAGVSRQLSRSPSTVAGFWVWLGTVAHHVNVLHVFDDGDIRLQLDNHPKGAVVGSVFLTGGNSFTRGD